MVTQEAQIWLLEPGQIFIDDHGHYVKVLHKDTREVWGRDATRVIGVVWIESMKCWLQPTWFDDPNYLDMAHQNHDKSNQNLVRVLTTKEIVDMDLGGGEGP